jgi:hypothetical protein
VDGTDSRLSLAVLAVGAALVLAGGAVWWVTAAPEVEAQPAPVTVPVVEPEPESVAPEQVDNGLESALPEFPDTVRREVGRIDPETTFVLHVPSDKDREYQLQYVCLGPGDLSVRIRGTADGEALHEVDCEGNLSAFAFVAGGTAVVIEVHRPGPEPADVGVQVIDGG